MANVSSEDRNAMADILRIMNGEKPSKSLPSTSVNNGEIELAGPGQVTSKDIDAMAKILSKLNKVSVPSILHENVKDPELSEAFETEKISSGVKIGKYQIRINENAKRLAGKQYYSIYHTITNDVIADDISLYETAISVVRLLNNGKFVNNNEIRKLFEYDTTYTAHKADAVLYKYRLKKNTNPIKQDIYESRYQASLDKAMLFKKQIKNISNNVR